MRLNFYDEQGVIISRFEPSLNKTKIFLFLILILLSLNIAPLPVRPELAKDKGAIKIMLSPSGDSTHPGRIIDGASEHAITLALAYALQNQIEQLIPHVQVIVTRTANEPMRPLADANFANRLDADLFISLHCYQETFLRPQIALYTYSDGTYAPSRKPELAFYPYDQAHLLNAATTEKYAIAFEQALKMHTDRFDVVEHIGIPFKSLLGVKAPAIGIEIGIKNKNGWQQMVASLAEGVVEMVKN